MSEKISTLRAFVCDGLMYGVIGKPEVNGASPCDFGDDFSYFSTLLTAGGESERSTSMLETLKTIAGKAAEIMEPGFNANAAPEDKVVIENQKTRMAQEQLLVKNLDCEFINIGSPLAVDLVPYADPQVSAAWCLNFAHPHVRIFPNKYHLSALYNLTQSELASADPSVRLCVRAVSLALRALKALRIRPVALAMQNSVSTGMLKYGYFWLPDTDCPEILAELKGLEAEHDGLRVIGAVSSRDRKKLRPRETPVLSMVTMIITGLMNELTAQMKLSAEEGMLFQGSRLVSSREEAIELFAARAKFLAGGNKENA